MQLRTRKKWLKAAAVLAFSQFCFLTGTFQAQAEETTPSQPAVETTVPAPVEAVEVQPVEEAVPAVETPAEPMPETDAPTTNSKAALDQTIGEAQNPGDSPAVTQPVEPEAPKTDSLPESSEESTSNTTSSSEPAESAEKPVEQPVDTKAKDTEEKTEDSVVASDTKETTLSEKEVEETFVVTQPRSARVRRAAVSTRAANDNIVRENLVGQGINWAIVDDPGRPGFTFNGIPMFTVNGQAAFCIQPGVDFTGNGQVHSTEELDTYLKDASKRHKITLISYFGYVNNPDKSKEQYFTTQLMIGEVLGRKVTWTYAPLNYNARKAAINKLVTNFNNKASFNNQTKTVKVGETIKVTDTTGFLSRVKEVDAPKGITAKIQGNQLVITVTKDAPEKVQIKLNQIKVAGAPMVYKKPGSQTIGVLNPIEPGRSVLNLNVLKQGNLEILKIDADTKKTLANAEIKVTINGKDQTVKTNDKGIATIKNFTHGTKGKVVEIKAPTGYVLNKTSKDFTIEANKTIKVTLENKEQLGIARIFKQDAEIGNNAQGAATLEGAIYGLYQADGKKIKSVTLKNINGKVQAEVRDLKLGSYYWVEEKAPAGYNLNTNKIHFELVYGDQNQETVTKEVTAKDQVIKGTIEGVKVGNKDFVDTKDPDNKPKLEGIEISLTSKTTGKVVKTVLTDKDGYFTFGKNAVVFDTYIVSETKGKEGYKLFEPFEVMISEQGQTFRYVLEDQIIEQQVKIVKVDQETGKVIPLANTEFKIFDTLANEYVTFAIPNDTEVTDIFRTNDKGYLVTNGTFTYGNNRYRIEEINAPRNYVLNKTPLVFSITDDTEPIKVINFANRQARKNVKLFKYEEWNKKKTPLAGVTFTLDNGEGKALGEYTTDTNGELLVKGLVAGAYYFVEKAPLESFQPNTDKQAFTVAFKQNAPDDGETLLVSVRNYLIPPTLETQASNKEDGEKVIDPLEKVVIKDSVSYTNLFVGKEYTISGVLMNKATNAPILQDGKEVTSTLTFVAESTDGTVNLDFVLDARALRGKEVVVFENLFREGVLLASHADITDKDQTIKIVNPTITTKATNKNGGKEIFALPNQTVLEWVKVDGLAIGQLYKLIVQGYLTPDGTPFEGTHAEKIFTADKETMEFLFEFLVDGRNLAGKGLSFAEWLQAKTEDEEETFEEVAKHNVDLTNKDQTVQIVEAPKPPQPEQPVKAASVVPMLPKTGFEDNHVWVVIGLIFVLAAGLIGYDLYKVKD